MRARLAPLLAGWLFVPAFVLAYNSPGSPAGYVNDFADLLTSEEEQTLNDKLTNFDRETSNQISVVTIGTLEGDTIENFATKLFAEWGIGGEKNDNGVLLLVARDEREVRIEVGYGLEGALTDIQANDIIDNKIVPAFKAEQYASGINGAVDDIVLATKGEYVASAPSGSANFFLQNGEFALFIILFVIQWLGAILARSKSWWLGGVLGAGLGLVVGLWLGWFYWGVLALIVLIPSGLFFDYIVSSTYKKTSSSGNMPWWMGGGHGGSGGGFGGFGGGMSGGGGASGRW